MPAAYTLHWIFSTANNACSVASVDCLLSGYHNTALQRIVVHLAVLLLVLIAMLVV